MITEMDSVVVEGQVDGGSDAARNTPDTFKVALHRTSPFTHPLDVEIDHLGDIPW